MKKVSFIVLVLFFMCSFLYAESNIKKGLDYYNQGKYSKAANIFIKACNMQNPNGCYYAGIVYNSGQGVKQNNIKAAKLYKKACDADLLKGCIKLSYTIKDITNYRLNQIINKTEYEINNNWNKIKKRYGYKDKESGLRDLASKRIADYTQNVKNIVDKTIKEINDNWDNIQKEYGYKNKETARRALTAKRIAEYSLAE